MFAKAVEETCPKGEPVTIRHTWPLAQLYSTFYRPTHAVRMTARYGSAATQFGN